MDYYKILDDLGMVDITREEFDKCCSSVTRMFNLVDDIMDMNDKEVVGKFLFTILYNNCSDQRTTGNKKLLCEGIGNEG